MLAEEHGTPVDVRWCLDQIGQFEQTYSIHLLRRHDSGRLLQR
jgi:hypothetical protein